MSSGSSFVEKHFRKIDLYKKETFFVWNKTIKDKLIINYDHINQCRFPIINMMKGITNSNKNRQKSIIQPSRWLVLLLWLVTSISSLGHTMKLHFSVLMTRNTFVSLWLALINKMWEVTGVILRWNFYKRSSICYCSLLLPGQIATLQMVEASSA